MQDTIITGTGNSHTLKTVADFLTRYPTYADFAAGFIAGEIPADIGPLVAAGVQQQGTALNKANLLTDATGTKLGLATTATPNDALSALASRYGTCATAAATAAKVVTLPGFSLATGTAIAVKFTYANTAASPTLNVNGTGAKSIAVYGTTAAGSGAWSAGEVVLFVYDGTRWVMNSGTVLGTGRGAEIYKGVYAGTGGSEVSISFPKPVDFLVISGVEDSPSSINKNYYGLSPTYLVDGYTLRRDSLIRSPSGKYIVNVIKNNNTVTISKSPSESDFLTNEVGYTYYYMALAAK